MLGGGIERLEVEAGEADRRGTICANQLVYQLDSLIKELSINSLS